MQKKKKSAMAEAPPQPVLSSKEAEQLSGFKKLEQHYVCQQHKKPCLIQPDSEHYQLTVNDLTKWAHLMVCFIANSLYLLLFSKRLATPTFSRNQQKTGKFGLKNVSYCISVNTPHFYVNFYIFGIAFMSSRCTSTFYEKM